MLEAEVDEEYRETLQVCIKSLTLFDKEDLKEVLEDTKFVENQLESIMFISDRRRTKALELAVAKYLRRHIVGRDKDYQNRVEYYWRILSASEDSVSVDKSNDEESHKSLENE